MRTEQYLQTHGIGVMPWDHASISERMWKMSSEMPNGCWHAPEYNAQHFRETVVSKMTNLNPRDLYGLTPTCGSRLCWNPNHICIVVATPLSFKEK